jgi:hypothetical protein
MIYLGVYFKITNRNIFNPLNDPGKEGNEMGGVRLC